MNWGNVYQSFEQAQNMQNMNFAPMNSMPQMNQMGNNMNMNSNNNPMEQIQLMANLFQNQNNQNIPRMNSGGNPNLNNMNNQSKKINLCFSTLKGARINMTFDSKVTVDEILTKFLKRVNLENLINNLQGKLNFILSAETLQFGDHRKVMDIVYMPSGFSTVLVHDSKNLIGAKKY